MTEDHWVEVVVQRVQTWWTVESRGEPGATARNAAPLAFPLPPNMGSGLHEVVMRERSDFRPQMRQTDLSDPGLPLHVIDCFLRVRPPVIPGISAPRRNRRPPAVRLASGQWLRWQINYRLMGTSGGPSHYRLDTFNVYFGPIPSSEVFLAIPTFDVDERGYVR